ncbi:MAG TPA: bifunctional adenosylcobinamide kinase/adenosylcobinamide-phosphate guanylyltransferase [Victivallales bacterium]|mgnify:CR=1 FL=1|nr:bifunctional adenosylcobinamide kinase/adenosylcobinamide-phosphate guanylyltransferase [Victivallales bacterium]HRU01037.1 bifunctional adenosylcobinamide kinase/adenosylcobinamide-phosphate guanylyltransferase [Victivallales bacterium]
MINSKGKIILISGGARSGKSSMALDFAKNSKSPFYIATGWAGDEEMAARIAKHQIERGERWKTIEERFFISSSIEKAVASNADFIVVDCLTIWLSNMMLNDKDWLTELKKCLEFLEKSPHPVVVFVSNEVGCGIVPGDKVSREFRDNAGTVNKIFANFADEVYLCFCGIPVKIKG